MEQDLKKIYRKSAKDITKKWTQYMEREDKRLSALRESGSIREYQEALGAYTLRNQHYKDMLDEVTLQLAHVNEKALAYTKDQLSEIYAINYNQAKETADEVGVSFTLVNESVVKRMARDGDIELPNQDKRVNIPKDQRWNTKQLNSSVLQGILQGESMDKIADRIYPVVGRNESAAIRNARTMVTGAENRGRLDSYKQLEEDGLVLKKVWMATPDGRTRDWHIDMDGQEVNLDENFIDGLGNELEYPGDPGGAPETVYNCRCTMVTDVVGFRRSDGSVNEISINDADTEHEVAIEKEKRDRKNAEKKDVVKNKDLMQNTGQGYSAEEIKQMQQLLRDDGKPAEAYELCEDKMKPHVDDQKRGKAFYRPGSNTVHIDKKSVVSGSNYEKPYQVHFHEYGHNMDYLLGKDAGTPQNVPLSMLYRSEDGRTFEEIITAEWDKLLQPAANQYLKDTMLESARMNLDTKEGGMGWESFISSEIMGYRKYAGLDRRDDTIVNMKNEAYSFDNDVERLNWYYSNIDKFIASAKYGGSVSSYDIKEAQKSAITDFCDEIKSNHSLSARSDLSDMFERYSVKHGGPAYPFGIGHGKQYQNRDGALAKETFAEMTAAEISNPESLELIKEYLPESYSAYHDMINKAISEGGKNE